MNTVERLRNLKGLLEHPGWGDVSSIMRDEIVIAAYNLAEAERIPDRSLWLQLGAIKAGRQFLDMVPKIIKLLENELLLEEAIAKSDKPLA